MVTFNALSVFKFNKFLEFILEKRKSNPGNALVDISILHDPGFLNLLILDDSQKCLIHESLQFMKDNSSRKIAEGFFDFEIAKMERLSEYAKTQISQAELLKRRIDFVSFVTEYDRRKNTQFLKCFPELADTFGIWQGLKMNEPVHHKIFKTASRLAHHQLPRLF